MAITPCIGTKRFSVKITLVESALLSAAFTNSVDGSTLEKIGCPYVLSPRTKNTENNGFRGRIRLIGSSYLTR